MIFMPFWMKKLGRGLLLSFSRWIFAWPFWFRLTLAQFLVFLWWDVLGVRRTVLYRNLCIAFPKKSRAERTELAKDSLRNLILDLFEVLSIPSLNQDWLQTHMEFEGEDNLRKAFERKKGVLALGMHVGCGDLAISTMTMKGYPLHTITKRFKSPLADKIWFLFRGGQSAQFMEAHGSKTAYEILSLLKKNRMIAFVIDQYMGPPYGIKTDFFGRSTGTAYGLALFAIRTGAPIVPIYLTRKGDGRHRLIIEEELALPSVAENLSRDEQVLVLTQFLNDQLERIIRLYPRDWMWVHRRWKEFG